MQTGIVAISDRHLLALEEARRGLDQQQADLNSLRDRSGNLLQFGGLAAAFVGSLAWRDAQAVTTWSVAAAATFAVLAVLVIYVLWPRYFTFSNDARIMLGNEWDLTPAEIAEHLAVYLAGHADDNRRAIRRMMIAYETGMVAFLAEIAFLLIDLWGR